MRGHFATKKVAPCRRPFDPDPTAFPLFRTRARARSHGQAVHQAARRGGARLLVREAPAPQPGQDHGIGLAQTRGDVDQLRQLLCGGQSRLKRIWIVPLMTIIIICSCSKELPKTFYLRNIFYQMPGLRLGALRGSTSPCKAKLGCASSEINIF